MLNERRILLGVTGGIAAYKSVELAGRLVRAGASVKSILTEHATRFVAPLTFASITGDRVATDMFQLKDPLEHISLADWAELLIVAPATANIIGKLAHGIADDLLSTCALAHTAPRLLVPAMNVHMYENPLVRNNLDRLADFGWRVMPADHGRLACGYTGQGRMPDPSEIFHFADSVLQSERDLVGKSILITAGGCREAIDPIRFIGNRSSGRMGIALARAAYARGAEVVFIHGDIDEPLPYFLEAIRTESAAKMREAVLQRYDSADAVFMAAAVTDYTVANPSPTKLKKGTGLTLELTTTMDILAELGQAKSHQLVVGFALESENVEERGREKLTRKHCDFLAANHASVLGSTETTVEWLSSDSRETFSGAKLDVAHRMLDRVRDHWAGQ